MCSPPSPIPAPAFWNFCLHSGNAKRSPSVTACRLPVRIKFDELPKNCLAADPRRRSSRRRWQKSLDDDGFLDQIVERWRASGIPANADAPVQLAMMADALGDALGMHVGNTGRGFPGVRRPSGYRAVHAQAASYACVHCGDPARWLRRASRGAGIRRSATPPARRSPVTDRGASGSSPIAFERQDDVVRYARSADALRALRERLSRADWLTQRSSGLVNRDQRFPLVHHIWRNSKQLHILVKCPPLVLGCRRDLDSNSRGSEVDRSMSNIYPVILSGGSGTRLWPLSRAMYPKQFIRFFNGQTSSSSVPRWHALPQKDGFEPPILLCNNDHRFLVREEVERAGIKPYAIILEPIARNTAPAIAVAALLALKDDPDAILAVMPSDHVIDGRSALCREAIRRAAEGRRDGQARPVRHQADRTAHGLWLHQAGRSASGLRRRRHSASIASPKSLIAKQPRNYLADGSYFWNSGIFVLNAKTYLSRDRALRAENPRSRARRLATAPTKISVSCASTKPASRFAEYLDRLRRDGENDTRPPSCRSTSAGTTSARGRRCGTSRRAMTKATSSRARLFLKIRRAATFTPRNRSSRRSASTISSSSTRPMRCWSRTKTARKTSRKSCSA